MSQASDAYLQPPFPTVEQGLSLIDEGEPEQLSTDCLHSDLEWFASVQRSLDALSARWLAELDHRQREDDDPTRPSPASSGCTTEGPARPREPALSGVS
ncbi:MAG TPA: hypothetical protein VKF59_22065 [Candidatus Dormibacteraeota bacterium]|nr:hypothetical protein [Candidatus Dormibacteraeota bacterium]